MPVRLSSIDNTQQFYQTNVFVCFVEIFQYFPVWDSSDKIVAIMLQKANK